MLKWLNLLPWPYKLGACLAIIGALFLALRWYGNKQWEKGVEEGFVRAATEIEKVKKAEWAEREKEIAVKEKQANQKLDDLTYAANAVHSARATLIKNFDVTLKEMENNRVEAYRYAGSVADNDLVFELRAVSRELAAAGTNSAGDEADSWSAP